MKSEFRVKEYRRPSDEAGVAEVLGPSPRERIPGFAYCAITGAAHDTARMTKGSRNSDLENRGRVHAAFQ